MVNDVCRFLAFKCIRRREGRIRHFLDVHIHFRHCCICGCIGSIVLDGYDLHAVHIDQVAGRNDVLRTRKVVEIVHIHRRFIVRCFTVIYRQLTVHNLCRVSQSGEGVNTRPFTIAICAAAVSLDLNIILRFRSQTRERKCRRTIYYFYTYKCKLTIGRVPNRPLGLGAARSPGQGSTGGGEVRSSQISRRRTTCQRSEGFRNPFAVGTAAVRTNLGYIVRFRIQTAERVGFSRHVYRRSLTALQTYLPCRCVGCPSKSSSVRRNIRYSQIGRLNARRDIIHFDIVNMEVVICIGHSRFAVESNHDRTAAIRTEVKRDFLTVS